MFSPGKKIDALATATAISDIFRTPTRPGYKILKILKIINVEGKKISAEEMNALGRLATTDCGLGISYCKISSTRSAAKIVVVNI